MRTVSKGCLFRRPESPHWFLKYRVDGRIHRETSGTRDRDQARRLLMHRIAEIESGRFIGRPQRPTFDEMRARLLENYAYKRNRTDPARFLKRLELCFGHLRGDDITEERILEYSRMRLVQHRAAPATLRRELAVLKRMLRVSSHLLPRVPRVDLPRVDNARQGFFEEVDFQAISEHLPAHAKHLVEFLYLTGWRSSEALRLTWADIDWRQAFVLLRDPKNREPRIFPFREHPRLARVLRAQREAVSRWEREHGCTCAAVFHWKGRPLQKLRRSWKTACRRAGLPGRLLHDFRRTAVRNLIRAGVQQAIAMKITGHKTESIFRRYLIVDEELLTEATGAVADFLGDPTRDRPHLRPVGDD